MLSVKMMHVWWKQTEWWSWENLLRSSWNITSQKKMTLKQNKQAFAQSTKWKCNKEKHITMTPFM
jgi:hypothetical protein